MSGAIAGMASRLLPELGSAQGSDLSSSFASMLGGGGSPGGAAGSGSGESPDSMLSGAGADQSSGAASGSEEEAAGGMDSLKQSAMQNIAQQSPDLLQHYNLDIKHGDGNAAAGDLANMAKQDPSLSKDIGVLAATVGTDAEPGGGGKLSGKATKKLQEALPDARIDVGSNAINRAGDSIKKSVDSGLENMGGALGKSLNNAETKLGSAPGMLAGV